MRDSAYHKILRVSAVSLTFVLVFVSGLLIERTAHLATQTQLYLANVVGVSVGVEETELNRITAALTEREQVLAERERSLQRREIDVGLRTEDGQPVATLNTTLIIAALLFVIVVLLILNYVLDYLRYQRFVANFEARTNTHPTPTR